VNPLRTKIFLNGIYRFMALTMVFSTEIQSSFLGPCPSSDRYELMAFIGVSMVLIYGVLRSLSTLVFLWYPVTESIEIWTV